MNINPTRHALLAAPSQRGGADTFDAAKPGATINGWHCGLTGSGNPRWVIEVDPTAPTKPNVLKQVGEGDFPWCVMSGPSFADGFVETHLKLVSGQEDQAGGVIWRFKDTDNYALARANASEGNVTVFEVVKGRRRAIKSIDLEVSAKTWHTLRVEVSGQQVTVYFNGKRVIDTSETQVHGSGGVGVWTKAESVTAFDCFSAGPK